MSNVPTTPPVDGWSAGVSGLWSNAANWGAKRIPKAGDDVEIDSGVGVTVTFDVSNLVIAGLTLIGDTLTLQGGALATSSGATFQSATVNGAKPLTLSGATTINGLTLGGSVALNNKGAVTQSGGTLAIGGSAVVNNLAGATWTLTDASGMTQGTATGYRFINSGTFSKTSGAGFYAWIYANFYSTGTIASTVNGDIIFDGKMTKLSGTYIGAGMVDYGPDGVATVGPVQVTQSSCQSNFGTVNLVGDMTVYDGSTIQNASGAHWNFAGDVSILLAAGQAAGPDIYGPGFLVKTKGTGTSHVSVDAEITGTVSVLTGTLSFEGETSTFSSTISGAGTFQIDGGADIEAGARLAVAHWTLAGGQTTLDENISYAGVFSGEDDAVIALNGHSLTLGGPTSLSGLDISGDGTLNIRGATTISGLPGLTVDGSISIVDNGAVTQTDDSVFDLTGEQPSQDERLTIAAGASWTLEGSSGIGRTGTTGAIVTIASSGQLIQDSASANYVFVDSIYNNSGASAGIDVKQGVLQISGNVLGTGVDRIDGGELTFAAAVYFGQTVEFTGPDQTLALQDPLAFLGSIHGFDQHGADDALIISDAFYVSQSIGATSAQITIGDGVSDHILTLTGDYRGGAFAVQRENGYTKITY